jgi:hypothetical protein
MLLDVAEGLPQGLSIPGQRRGEPSFIEPGRALARVSTRIAITIMAR